jgi:preprotein translocase subunit SecB
MADEETKPEAAAAGSTAAVKILSQYVRDLSFENVAAQKGLTSQKSPDITVQVNLDAKQLSEDRFEVAVKMNVDAKVEDAPVFLLELDYAGGLEITGVPKEQIHPFLMIECPRLLFPFVRRIISDVSRDGGFPPLNIDNIDFLGLYKQELARRVEAAQADQSEGEAIN